MRKLMSLAAAAVGAVVISVSASAQVAPAPKPNVDEMIAKYAEAIPLIEAVMEHIGATVEVVINDKEWVALTHKTYKPVVSLILKSAKKEHVGYLSLVASFMPVVQKTIGPDLGVALDEYLTYCTAVDPDPSCVSLPVHEAFASSFPQLGSSYQAKMLASFLYERDKVDSSLGALYRAMMTDLIGEVQATIKRLG